jgi:2-(1,2-epoxy-1,2-dihydrophenyl)acetyl-CoA isomerase
MTASVLYSVADGVATITLNRPQVMNALDAGMIGQLRAAAERCADDALARAVIIRGNGPAFLAGGDVSVFRANLPRLPQLVREGARELHHAISALRRAPKPVLACVHGAVAGAGVSLLAASDLAIAADDTQFTLELMLLSDPVDARTALQYGLVNWVTDATRLAAETAAIASRLAKGATVAYAETKRLVGEGQERALAGQLDAEAEAFARCAGTRDFAEGVTAFVEKRKPDFKGH